jgi:hypothetical protein
MQFPLLEICSFILETQKTRFNLNAPRIIEHYIHTVVDPGFVGFSSYTIFGVLLAQKKTKLGTKLDNYLGLLPVTWKGPVQVRGPEIEA